MLELFVNFISYNCTYNFSSSFGAKVINGKIEKFYKTYFYKKGYLKLNNLYKKSRFFNCLYDISKDKKYFFYLLMDSKCDTVELRKLWKKKGEPTNEWYY